MPRTNSTARVVAAVFSPTLVTGVLFPLTGGLALHSPVGVAWGLLAAVFTAAVPALIVHRGVRTGRWSDHHVSRREQRAVPLAASLVSVVAGLVVLVVLDAPRAVVALAVAVLATLVVGALTTLVWKISLHAAVVTASAVTLTVVGGGWWALAWVVVPVVAWARLRAAAHTVAQVTAGALLGGGLTLAVLLVAHL